MKKLETTLAILSIAISIAAIIISHHANKICKEAEQLQKINAAARLNEKLSQPADNGRLTKP